MLDEKFTEKALDFIKDYVSTLRAFRKPTTAAFKETVDMLTEWGALAAIPNEKRRERLTQWAYDLHESAGLDSPSTVSLIEKTLDQGSEGLVTVASIGLEVLRRIEPLVPNIMEVLGMLGMLDLVDDETEPPN